MSNNGTNARWTEQEEISLLKDISNGVSLDLLSQKHNRSVSAIELRLKRRIYDNVQHGKSLHEITKVMKMNSDKVAQYYWSYKEFKENKDKNKDKNKDTNVQNSVPFIQPTVQTFQPVQINSQIPVQFQVPSSLSIQAGGGDNDVNNAMVNKAFEEPKVIDKLEMKLKKLETENRILKLVVENRELRGQLKKLIKEGKVDESIKNLIKVLVASA